MNKSEAIEKMRKIVLDIEEQEDKNRYTNDSAMRKDVVKKILKELEEVNISED